MAQVVISNVDERVKQNFETFCSGTGANEARLFSSFVEFCLSFNRQGLFQIPSNETLQKTPSQLAAAKFLAASKKIAGQGFTAEDKEAFNRLDSGEYSLKFQGRGLEK